MKKACLNSARCCKNKTLLRPLSLLIFICLVPVPGIAFSQTPSQIEGSLWDWISSLLVPNLPGAVLLLVMSTLISMLTFYSDMKRSAIRGKGSVLRAMDGNRVVDEFTVKSPPSDSDRNIVSIRE